MKIRKASIEDFEEILELYFAFLTEDNDGTYDPKFAYSERSKELLKNCIEKNDGFVYVCEDNGKLVGFMKGWLHFRKESRKQVLPANIDEIYIKEGYRGQGMGKDLLNKFEKWAKTKGANKLKVGAFYDNNAAKNLYKGLGFKEWVIAFEKDI